MKKSLIALFLILAVVLSLSACGEKDNKPSYRNSSTLSESQSISEEANENESTVSEVHMEESTPSVSSTSKTSANQENSKTSTTSKASTNNTNNTSPTSLLAVSTGIDKASYIRDAIKQAETSFVSYTDYMKALNIIKQAQQKYPDDADLKAKENYYKSFAPVSIFDLKSYTKSDYAPSEKSNKKDTMGNTYEMSLMTHDLPGHQTYDIGKKYNILKGKASILDTYGNMDNFGFIKIYGDGILLYSKTNFTGSTKPLDISVDITGVTDLKIEMGKAQEYAPYILFSDITLQRTAK